MARCELCGVEVDLPFICNYCRRPYCVSHRLPEAHECPNLIFARPPNHVREVEERFRKPPRLARPVLTSEFKQLLLAWFVLGFCFSINNLTTPRLFLTTLSISLGTLGLGFIGHELAHRYVARRLGCWAEFRVWPTGLLMALIFAVASWGRVIFAAPGAVYIIPRSPFGYGIGKRENGLISISGPLTNIGVALIFLAVSRLDTILNLIGVKGFHVNLWLAAFNLLPFGMMDGQKIFNWSKAVWALLAIPAWLALLVLQI
ncbi:MAG: AN1-type zinc finger domain-containing protein [Candidatus Bathyarchaeia archaeon]